MFHLILMDGDQESRCLVDPLTSRDHNDTLLAPALCLSLLARGSFGTKEFQMVTDTRGLAIGQPP
mgnify:CR=1 FL=1